MNETREAQRARVRPTLPDCWKCGVKHFQDEPCDVRGAVTAIDWPIRTPSTGVWRDAWLGRRREVHDQTDIGAGSIPGDVHHLPTVGDGEQPGGFMSNTVAITLPDDEYAQLKALAEEQDRYISGQARHMLRAELKRLSGENEPLNGIRKFTGVVVPDDLLGACGATSAAPPVPSATYLGDDSPDSTLGEQQRAKQKPLLE